MLTRCLLLTLSLLAPLISGCAIDQLVREADEMKRQNRELERELAAIVQQWPELTQRVDRVLVLIQQADLEMKSLAASSPDMAAALQSPSAAMEAALREVDEIRSQAAQLDRQLRSAYIRAQDVAQRSERVSALAHQVRSQIDVLGQVGNMVGRGFGIQFSGPRQQEPPQDPSTPTNLAGWLFGMGTAAMAGTGIWAYSRYGRRRTPPGTAGAAAAGQAVAATVAPFFAPAPPTQPQVPMQAPPQPWIAQQPLPPPGAQQPPPPPPPPVASPVGGTGSPFQPVKTNTYTRRTRKFDPTALRSDALRSDELDVSWLHRR